MEYVGAHAIELSITFTNIVLAHVTWRALPEEHRHTLRRVARVVMVTRRTYTGKHYR
jgi:hypothetical protein